MTQIFYVVERQQVLQVGKNEMLAWHEKVKSRFKQNQMCAIWKS